MKIEKKKKKTLKNIGQVDYTVIDTLYCMYDSFSQTLKVFIFKYSLFTERKINTCWMNGFWGGKKIKIQWNS